MSAVAEKKPRGKKSKAVGVIERPVTQPIVEQRSLRKRGAR